MTQPKHPQIPAYQRGSLPDAKALEDVQIIAIEPGGGRTLLRSDGSGWIASTGEGNMLGENNLSDLQDPEAARVALELAEGATAPKASYGDAISGVDDVAFITPAVLAAYVANALTGFNPGTPPDTPNNYADSYVAPGYVD